MIKLDKKVALVFHCIQRWEEDNDIEEFSKYNNHIKFMELFIELHRSLKIKKHPDVEIDPKEWNLFIINEIINYVNTFNLTIKIDCLTEEVKKEIVNMIEERFLKTNDYDFPYMWYIDKINRLMDDE